MPLLGRRGAPPPPAEQAAAWERALAKVGEAEAGLRAAERGAKGASWDEQCALDEVYSDLSVAFGHALEQALAVPAPDLAALALKIEWLVDHDAATLGAAETSLAALKADARRLAAL